MNLNEIKKPSDKMLTEELEQGNTTGVLTEDLVSMVRAHEDAEWDEGMTATQINEWVDGLVNGKA